MVQVSVVSGKTVLQCIVVAVLLLALAGCGGASPSPGAVPAVPDLIWDVRGGRALKPDALERRLSRAPVVLIGEVHDNPRHHAIEAGLIRTLARMGRHDAVALEMLDRAQQAELDRLWREAAGVEAVLEAMGFDDRGWGADQYRPVVAAMHEAEVIPVAANLSRAEAGRVMREGGEALFGAQERARLALDAAWPAEAGSRLVGALRESHCHALPEDLLPGMLAAQRARDAVLADRLLTRLADGVILVAGAQHVRRDYGVPVYLAAREPGLEVAVVRLVEVDGERPVADYLEGGAFDYLWFTTRTARPDPCEQFRRQGAAGTD